MPVDSGWPASRFAALLNSGAKQNQDQLDADLQGWLSEEHTANGEHGNINAESITLAPADPSDPLIGTVVLQDEGGTQTILSRTQALDTAITMHRSPSPLTAGLVVLIRAVDRSGTITNLEKLGYVQHGSALDPGITLLAQAASVYNDWAIVSGQGASSEPSLIVGDLTTGIDPLAVRYRSGVPAYELMKKVGGAGPTTELVTLGSGLDSSLQGYFDEAYTKRLSMQTLANSHAFAGEWSDVAFSAGNFTAGGAQTWTLTSGDQTSYAYTLIGHTMTLAVALDTTSVGGTPNPELRIAVPLGLTVAGRSIINTFWGIDNGVVTVGRLVAGVGNAYISVFNQAGANWTASANNTAVQGQITFSING